MDDEHGDSGGAQPWDDFLTSTVRPLDSAELDRFTGKRILITGAGGYLGSALVRALAALPVESLILLDQSEYGLYRLKQELRGANQTAMLVGSVLDPSLLSDTFHRYAPEWVLHAAALKHVPLMEENPFAAAETNVLGTQAVVEASSAAGAERVLLVSTDKAVDPINVMGATKRIAEQIMFRAAQDGSTMFTVARLCNVLGATGSVAPLFVRQVLDGGPVTVTHAEATRYFISRTDAVRFLLRSAVAPIETGLVVPLLREPCQVLALAEFLVRRLGQSARAIHVVETGLRGGDKLHERLVSSAEEAAPDKSGDFVLAQALFERYGLEEALQGIRYAVRARDLKGLLAAIRRVVPTYRAQSTSPAKDGGA